MNGRPDDESTNRAEAEFFVLDRVKRRTQLLYSNEMRERKVFMQDLKQYRNQFEKSTMRKIRKLVGPRWYQVLSVPQRKALDQLEDAIYQDLLEGLPGRTSKIMRALGIYPPPNPIDLMNCNFYGSNDPMNMLAELFFLNYGHSIEGKRGCYNLNARLMLSGIFYLGLKNLLELLHERFKPDQDPIKTPTKPKPKRGPPLPSPYLEKSVIRVWYPASPKKFTPPPLPNLDELNEPYLGEDEHRVQLKQPPPPPPPPPPKRVPRDLCDKLAGIIRIEPNTQVTALTIKTTTTRSRKRQNSNLTTEIKKKTYGICIERTNKKSCRRRLRAPTTGLNNMQYLIQGVYTVRGRTVFVLGSVSITPSDGELIHGGFAFCNGTYTNVHLGYRAHPAALPPDPCDCLKWQDKIFEYVKESKCYCGHNYDFGHEGTFPKNELPYFHKPEPGAPFKFDYDTIFDLDEKQLFVKNKFKNIWETDSVIGTKEDLVVKKKEKKATRSSKTCLGERPKPKDYLKCALRLMRGMNVAARLPDIHLAPELVEWMRRRLHGPRSAEARLEYLQKSKMLQSVLECMTLKGYGRVRPQRNPDFAAVHSDWNQAMGLRENFNKHRIKFRRQLFNSFANVNNLFWRIMFHPEFPDKKFREIFFSYLSATAEEVMLMNPYDSALVLERKERMMKQRYVCPPAGVENLDS